MAETPASPEHDPSTSAAATDGAATETVPADLEAVLAAALDEDDLPEPHPPAPTPTLEAATARPTVGSYGAPDADSAPAPALAGSYGSPDVDSSAEAGAAASEAAAAVAEASPAVVGSYGASASAPAASGEPTVATTLEVAPRAGAQAGEGSGAEGGEFDLLVSKIKAWFDQADLAGQWDRLSGPLRGLGLLLGAVLVMKLYLALLDTLDDVPLLPRLLQLLGLIWLFNFSLTRLTRSGDRKEILEDWKRRWDAFRGS
ncbi:MAG: CAAD domain-containing protein [Cyanobium sp.]